MNVNLSTPTLVRENCPNILNLNRLNSESNSETLQDFEQILLKFGIAHNKLIM